MLESTLAVSYINKPELMVGITVNSWIIKLAHIAAPIFTMEQITTLSKPYKIFRGI